MRTPEVLPAQPIRIGVVLLNYCGSSDTLACLDSLLASDYPLSRVVLADNASPDGSLQRLRDGLKAREGQLQAAAQRAALPDTTSEPGWQAHSRASMQALPASAQPAAWLTLLDNQDNRGFAAGNNPGIAWLLRDPAISHVWLLNNDTELPPDSLSALVPELQRRPEIDLWGGTVRYHAEPRQVQALCGGALNPRSAETRHLGAFLSAAEVPRSAEAVAAIERLVDYALGACMLASRHWVQQVGLLSERYFLYYEELDWATRGRRLGLRLGYAPQWVVFHKEGASIGTAPGGGSPLSVRHLVRSRLLFARQFLPARYHPWLFWGVLKQGLKLLLRGRWTLVRAVTGGALDGWSIAKDKT